MLPGRESIVSLDFLLAFDHYCPTETVSLFPRLSIPASSGQMLLSAWTNKRQYIEYEGCVLQAPEKVRSSFPQGDAWSLYCLIALLTPLTIDVQNSHPNAVQKTYVDDRSGASNLVQRPWQLRGLPRASRGLQGCSRAKGLLKLPRASPPTPARAGASRGLPDHI